MREAEVMGETSQAAGVGVTKRTETFSELDSTGQGILVVGRAMVLGYGLTRMEFAAQNAP